MQRYTQPLNVWLGKCDDCVRPVRIEVDGELLPATQINSTRVTGCVECGGHVIGTRLWGETTDMSCDGRCMGAIGNQCSCACGGKNHGKWFAERTYREVPETEGLRRYRAEQIKLAQKRQAKAEREAKAKRDAFNEWATSNQDVVDWLQGSNDWDTDGRDQFLWDMLEMVRLHKILTERQADAVRRVRDARVRRTAQREAERTAVTEPLPTGRVEVTGTVVSTKSQEGDFGPVWKMLVKGDGGWKVWTTIPRDLLSQLDGETGYTSQLEELRNRRVRFTATIEASRSDPTTFGFGKRPSKGQLLPVG